MYVCIDVRTSYLRFLKQYLTGIPKVLSESPCLKRMDKLNQVQIKEKSTTQNFFKPAPGSIWLLGGSLEKPGVKSLFAIASLRWATPRFASCYVVLKNVFVLHKT
jgi:hypothetical protein